MDAGSKSLDESTYSKVTTNTRKVQINHDVLWGEVPEKKVVGHSCYEGGNEKSSVWRLLGKEEISTQRKKKGT